MRNPNNTNLNLHHGGTYLNLPILEDKGPFNLEHLELLKQTLFRALGQNPRVFAMRFDLHFPLGINLSHLMNDNAVVDHFIESLKAKIKWHRTKAKAKNPYAHDTVVRYFWTREVGQFGGRPHYHFIVFLNNDAYNSAGDFASPKASMIRRFEESWALATGLCVEAVRGLVHIPDNPVYHIKRDDPDSIAEFFRRASYLCKVSTKEYGQGIHTVGASRI